MAYLVTAPRFLGYVFNPVSFWYLFSKDYNLNAMILEVNNTFGERRMYFMDQDNIIPTSNTDGQAMNMLKKFKNSWAKDFHVSPFNSRKGSYSLVADDPFSVAGGININNIITLQSSKDHAKLVARLFSTGSYIDPFTMTTWSTLRFILSWWWVGLVTFPRIVKEAAKLYFCRKLHVWYRPEVLAQSLGRQETYVER